MGDRDWDGPGRGTLSRYRVDTSPADTTALVIRHSPPGRTPGLRPSGLPSPVHTSTPTVRPPPLTPGPRSSGLVTPRPTHLLRPSVRPISLAYTRTRPVRGGPETGQIGQGSGLCTHCPLSGHNMLWLSNADSRMSFTITQPGTFRPNSLSHNDRGFWLMLI